MARYLFIASDYRKWNPDSSPELALIEAAIHRNLDAHYIDRSQTDKSFSRPILFAEAARPCFIGFGPRTSITEFSFDAQLDMAFQDSRFQIEFSSNTCPLSEIRELESKCLTASKTSSLKLIDEIESLRLNGKV